MGNAFSVIEAFSHSETICHQLHFWIMLFLTLPFCESGKVAGLKPDPKRSFFLPPLSKKLLFVLFCLLAFCSASFRILFGSND